MRLPAICRGNETPASSCRTTRGGVAEAGAEHDVAAADADEFEDVIEMGKLVVELVVLLLDAADFKRKGEF